MVGAAVSAVRVAVFDVGETLVDETSAWSRQADAAGVTRLTLFAALGAMIERGVHHDNVWGVLGVDPPAERREIRRADLYPDAVDCLRALHEDGMRIGLAGNQPEPAEAELDRLGLPVSFIASSAQWGVAKPSPRFFANVIVAADALPEQIAYIGDRLDNDILPARHAGMFTVFIRRGPWGYLHAQRPDASLAHARIDSLTELPALLRAWPAHRAGR